MIHGSGLLGACYRIRLFAVQRNCDGCAMGGGGEGAEVGGALGSLRRRVGSYVTSPTAGESLVLHREQLPCSWYAFELVLTSIAEADP